ncbi:MAG: hypothetical protein QXK06_02355, partial [Candidatus Diapherotrites archaeon]
FAEKKGVAEESINSPCFPESIEPEKAFLSNLLLSHYSKLSKEREIGRIFLENAAFQNFALLPCKQEQKKRNAKKAICQNLIELDFSRAILEKIAKTNLGPESLNCDCCQPTSINAENVLPNSLVEVEFLENGFYFDSSIPLFAKKFHESNSGKSSRLARKKEFFLESIPVGPFYFGQRAVVPLADAHSLYRNGFVRIAGEKGLKWHCIKKPSFLAESVSSILSLEDSLKKRVLEIEKKDVLEKGLNAFNPFFSNPEKAVLEAFLKACSSIIESVSLCLEIDFFSEGDFAEILEALNSGLVFKYNELLCERNSEPIYCISGRAFVKRMELFTDLAVISRDFGIPLPCVSKQCVPLSGNGF